MAYAAAETSKYDLPTGAVMYRRTRQRKPGWCGMWFKGERSWVRGEGQGMHRFACEVSLQSSPAAEPPKRAGILPE